MAISAVESLKNTSMNGNNEEEVSQKQRKRNKKVLRWLMKRRRARREGGGRTSGNRRSVETRVRTLKRLVPNSSGECEGLDGLFRETADYILRLKEKVKVMQRMVRALSNSEE